MNHIFPIPEIEDIMFDYMDPVVDLKNISMINHYYYDIINQRPFYDNLRDFCKYKDNYKINSYFRIDTIFIRSCFSGKLCVAKYIYHKNPVDIFREQITAFQNSCLKGHLNVVKWLYDSFQIDIHYDYEYAFRRACYNGHLDVAIWLYNAVSTGIPIQIRIYDDFAFKYSYHNKHIEIASWLCTLCDNYQLILMGNQVLQKIN